MIGYAAIVNRLRYGMSLRVWTG